MKDLVQLRAKLDRTQANIEKGVGHLVKQRVVIADLLAEGGDVTRCHELLENLEDTQLLHVQDRDRLRRELEGAFAGKEPTLDRLRLCAAQARATAT